MHHQYSSSHWVYCFNTCISNGTVFAFGCLVHSSKNNLTGDRVMKSEFLEGLSSICMAFLMCGFLVMPAMVVGCAEKEKVLDIETPNTDVEVERDVETGETDVEVTRDAAPAN
jgi:hypothetical protein